MPEATAYRPGRKSINAARAREIYDSSPRMTYRQAGALLAAEEGRRVAYSEHGMARAINKTEEIRG